VRPAPTYKLSQAEVLVGPSCKPSRPRAQAADGSRGARTRSIGARINLALPQPHHPPRPAASKTVCCTGCSRHKSTNTNEMQC